MAGGPNVKINVDLKQFNAGIREGQNILKGLNAEMKAADAAFKATGNAEQQLASKTKTLTSQLNVQKSIADQAAKALKEMADSGVKPTDQAYQKMYVTMMNAQAGMNEAQAALNAMNGSQQQAASSANELSESVGKIGKKLSLDQVISGIKSITDALENAGRAAVRAGEAIWNEMLNNAQWADDVSTQAAIFQMSVEDYQRVVNVAATVGDTAPNEMLKGWKTLKKNLVSDSAEVQKAFEQIGISRTEAFELEGGTPRWMQGMDLGTAKDWEDIFWDIGDALMAMGDSEKQEAIARTLLGRSWQDLIPMFTMGREEYEKALDKAPVVSDGTVQKWDELNTKVTEAQQNFDALKKEMLGQVAPALTEAADVISDLLGNLNEYLKTDEGQKMLQTMGETVRGLFEDLGKVDPKELVNNFTSVFTSLTDGMKWIVQNKDTLVNALKAVVTGWARLKLTGGALNILKLLNGLKEFGGGGGTGSGSGGGNAETAAKSTGNLLSNLIAGMGTKSVLDTYYNQYYATKDILNDQRLSIRQQQEKWVDAGISRGEINASERDRIIQANLTPFIMAGINVDEIPEVPVEMDLQTPEDAATKISGDIGTVQVPVELVVTNPGAVRPSGGGGGGAGTVVAMQKANGLPYVPYDNYLALLHKGEQVVPARATGNNFSSNLYVDRMIMNNGQDAQGLAGAVAAANRRIMRGYGS